VRASRASDQADPTLNLYRRQMVEIEDLVERGLLSEAEHRAARAEAGRRLLAAADSQAPSSTGRTRPALVAAAAAAVLAPVTALVVYLVIGTPGLPDEPMSRRLAAWRADPQSLDPARLTVLLQSVVKQKPDDVEGLRFLAQAQLAANNPFEATRNLRRAVGLAPDRADLWALLGLAIMDESDGLVTADSQAALREALKRDPSMPLPRYYLGRGRIESGAPAEGLVLWRGLLQDLPPGTSERDALLQQIAAVEQTGRLPQPAPAGAETQEMQAAIRGMVEGLASRLAAEPDNPGGWVRLVRAYSVLGETAKRDQALATARARYKDDPAMLESLRQAAAAP
jgi:cytochrome c-type biogenesis protein CcmH